MGSILGVAARIFDIVIRGARPGPDRNGLPFNTRVARYNIYIEYSPSHAESFIEGRPP